MSIVKTIKTKKYKFIFAADKSDSYQRWTLNILPTFRIEFYKEHFDDYITAIQIDWILWSIGVCVKRKW